MASHYTGVAVLIHVSFLLVEPGVQSFEGVACLAIPCLPMKGLGCRRGKTGGLCGKVEF